MNLDDINYPENPNDLEAFWMPFTANARCVSHIGM